MGLILSVSVISFSAWNTCLKLNWNTGRIILNQLEFLLDDVTGMLRTALGNLPPLFDSIGGMTTEEEVVNSTVSSSFSIK